MMPRWLLRIALTLLVTGAALSPMAACGDANSLVGGDCASGYAPCGNNCCPVTGDASRDGTVPGDSATDVTDATDTGLYDGFGADRVIGPGNDSGHDGAPLDGMVGDGSSGGDSGPPQDSSADAIETGPLCMAPLVDCGGVCVDTTSDPFNCGQCFNVCPSQICVMSMCQGSTAGGIVYIGHDYLNTPAGTAQARVLSNAVFIPQTNPLKVLDYERYAGAANIARVKAILNSFATQEGRGLSITSTSTDTDIPNELVFSAFQVLIVEDQSTAPSGAMATLGASWATTLTTFTQAGGIVVVLDGGTGVGEMPQLSTATTLLSVTAHAPITVGTPLDDVAPGDVVGVGVVSPYGAGRNSVSITTEASGGNVIYVIDLPSDAGMPPPVVVHKVF
jgi:hypothetical protein